MSNSLDGLSGLGETILLVDDNEKIWDFLIEALQMLNYSVLLAENGLDAVEIYKENPEQIDIVILDMIMPKSGGYEAFTKIREVNDSAKILLSSGFVSEDDVQSLLEKKNCAFLPKPHRINTIAKAIRTMLDGE